MDGLDHITGAIVHESLRIHRGVGPGLLESVYEAVLAGVLIRRGFLVQRQAVIASSMTAYCSTRAFARIWRPSNVSSSS